MATSWAFRRVFLLLFIIFLVLTTISTLYMYMDGALDPYIHDYTRPPSTSSFKNVVEYPSPEYFDSSNSPNRSSETQSTKLSLGFISKTYIISLPHRTDRRTDMSRLMDLLEFGKEGENWVYHDGTYSNTSLIGDLMKQVQKQRIIGNEDYSEADTIKLPFAWPEDASSNYSSTDRDIPPAGAELWYSQPPPDVALPPTPMVCAEDDFRLTKYTPSMLQWRFLTPERVAAYHSHLTAVRRIVDDNAKAPTEGKDRVALILEDDVDMEVDIEARLEILLPMLPNDWDVLYLGFCWSTETTHSPLTSPYLVPLKNLLYPSFQPRCLHAYALSPRGAVKFLTHLRHTQFAYGRSVDLATEWLVWEKRVKSFTVVPPVAIQRKVSKTDITLEGGAVWKETLEEGVLGTKESGNEV